MKMSHSAWIHISLAIVIALAALFLIRLHSADGVTSFFGSELPSFSREG
jgi:hypothetical protein